jgi:hypothetical protein
MAHEENNSGENRVLHASSNVSTLQAQLFLLCFLLETFLQQHRLQVDRCMAACNWSARQEEGGRGLKCN